jgi:hypothetical protein
MIRITKDEFNTLREGIASAHILIQSITPLLKTRRAALDKQQRQLMELAPGAVAAAFNLVAALTHKQNRADDAPQSTATVKVTDIDIKTMRDELENISALRMPDLDYEMACAIAELPGLNVHSSQPLSPPLGESRVAAIAWEAGRRYGVLQCSAIFDSTASEFHAATADIFQQILDSTLDVPAPGLPGLNAELIPFQSPSAEDLDAGNHDTGGIATAGDTRRKPTGTVN